jgi:superfamily I DNA/RNA helicase
MIDTPDHVVTVEQTAAIRHPDSNVYVGAGPGTGKTYLLVERYRFLRESGFAGSQILVLTFSRRAVLELRQRLLEAGFAANETEVRTFHGFAARAIGGGHAIPRAGRLLDGLSRELLLETTIDRTETPTIGEAARTSRPFRSDVKRLLDDLGRAPQIPTEIEAAASPRLRDMLRIARNSAAARARMGATEIGDLIERAVGDARKPGSLAATFLAGRYAHVLVDEFQDTDRAQLDLLEVLGARVFAVGDEAQSIYRFRGASDGLVAEAIARFGMQRFDLTLSRRCPPDVCALASQAPIPGLRKLESARDSGAAASVVRLRGIGDEVAFLVNAIEADVNSGRDPAKISVLLRNFRPVGPLVMAELRRRSIAVASIGREELLADTRIATLRAALEIFTRPTDFTSWHAFLTSPSLRFDPIAVRFNLDTVHQLGFDATLPQKLGRIVGNETDGAALADGLAHAREAWDRDELGTAAHRLVRALGLLSAIMHEENPSNVRVASGRLAFFCDALAGLQRTSRALGAASRCADLVARLEGDLPKLALDDAGLDANAAGVRVLTIHASKGLEFEHVFIADAVEGRFPQDDRPSSLLSEADRDLLISHGVNGPSIVPDGTQLEEASLWYVALTRSSALLTISFAAASLDGRVQRPSRFIQIARLPDSATVVDRESLYLRTLRAGDPAARAALLASDALASAPAIADYARHGEAAFATVRGLPIRSTAPLSVSNAETWLRCPRQLFYQRFARLRGDASPSMALGSALHVILNEFHGKYSVFDASANDIPAWTAELLALRERAWARAASANATDAAEFDSPAIAAAAGIAADAVLRSYARALGIRAEAGAFVVELRESDVTVTIGASELSGRVDRVDRMAGGSCEIVDYKLGSARAKPLSAVATDLVKKWQVEDAAEEPRTPLARRLTKDEQLQLALYATAFDRVAATTYVFMNGTKRMESRNGAIFETSAFDGALAEVTAAALHELETELLTPLASDALMTMPTTLVLENCTFCDFRRICPGPPDDAP